MSAGKVIVLQGASSAGKSTLATALQRALDEHWWVLEADDITRMQATSERTQWWQPTLEEKPHSSWTAEARLTQWLAGYFACIAAIAKTGSNVIAVGGWLETAWLRDMAAAFTELDAYCVGVYCSLEEAERREAARGDRRVGYARSHFDTVHAHAPYDLAVDAGLTSVYQGVQAINTMLAAPPDIPFFERVRSWHCEEGNAARVMVHLP